MTAGDRLQDLSLDEKASLTSGASFWTTEPIERAAIPAILLTDGPHGVRKQRTGGDHLGLGDSVPATCFPPAVALGSSWDAELVRRVGEALGAEAQAEGVGVLLGPGINIKRSPLCGRNFEYYSEDPLIAGVLGSAWVAGVQSRGVGASLKHFAVNNQETDRMRISVDVTERALREIYLRGFQRVVQTAQPWTVMCSYNRINGVYASENPWLLTSVLRQEWGFEGVVVSDWGAVNDRVAALVAGLDLEMPSSAGRTDAQISAAIRAGSLDERVLDDSVARTLALVDRVGAAAAPDTVVDVDAHHALAREAAARSVVLLKNDGGLLPLAPGGAERIAVIGEFARTPRYQGAGSSRIAPTRLDNAADEMRAVAGDRLSFAAGFGLDEGGDSAALRDEAVALAAGSDIAVLFLGLPAAAESEGFDRRDLELPAEQTALLDAVLAVQANVVVVLSNGGVVRTSGWDGRVPAIVEGWLLGQAGGGAIADVLFGSVNPSGRLAETIPVALADTPAYLSFPGELGRVRYADDILVGYRGFDAREAAVSYPFGHGLSYTSFEYGAVAVNVDDDAVRIRVQITNVGDRDGREVVQVYVAVPDSRVSRAVRSLVGFRVVAVAAGASETVTIEVPTQDLAFFNTQVGRWVVEAGEYRFEVGASSRDIRAVAVTRIAGEAVRTPLSGEATIDEWLADERGARALRAALAGGDGAMLAMVDDPGSRTLMGSMPLARLAMFPFSPLDVAAIDALTASVAD